MAPIFYISFVLFLQGSVQNFENNPNIYEDLVESSLKISDETEKKYSDISFLVEGFTNITFSTKANDPQLNLLLEDILNIDDLYTLRERRAYFNFFAILLSELIYKKKWVFQTLLDLGFYQWESNPIIEADSAHIEYFTSGEFLKVFNISLEQPLFNIQLGRFHTNLMDGLLYNNYNTGLEIELDLEDTLYFKTDISLVWVDTSGALNNFSSPLFTCIFNYEPSIFDKTEILISFFRDKNNIFSDYIISAQFEYILSQGTNHITLLDRIFEEDYSGDSKMFYLGMSGNYFLWDKIRFSINLLYMIGDIILYPSQENENPIELRGFTGKSDISYSLTSTLELGFTIFRISGDTFNVISQNQYGSFIGISPSRNWSQIFFSSDQYQTHHTGQPDSAGINGHGVIGTGPLLSYHKEKLKLETKILSLYSLIDPSTIIGGSGKNYGIEVNILLEWAFLKFLNIGIEANVLKLGRFFPILDTAYEFVVYFNGFFSKIIL